MKCPGCQTDLNKTGNDGEGIYVAEEIDASTYDEDIIEYECPNDKCNIMGIYISKKNEKYQS